MATNLNYSGAEYTDGKEYNPSLKEVIKDKELAEYGIKKLMDDLRMKHPLLRIKLIEETTEASSGDVLNHITIKLSL